jgi:hypothetical protein
MLWNRRRLATLARRTMAKAATLAAAVLDTTLEEAHMEVPATKYLTVTERSPDMKGRRTRRAMENSRPESRRLASTRGSVRSRSTTCPTVVTLERTKLLSCCQSTREKRDGDKKEANFITFAINGGTANNRDGQTAYLTAENLGVKVTVLADTGSDYSAIPRSAVEDARKRGFPLKVEVFTEPIMLKRLSGAKATSRSAARRRCSFQR